MCLSTEFNLQIFPWEQTNASKDKCKWRKDFISKIWSLNIGNLKGETCSSLFTIVTSYLSQRGHKLHTQWLLSYWLDDSIVVMIGPNRIYILIEILKCGYPYQRDDWITELQWKFWLAEEERLKFIIFMLLLISFLV